MSAPTIPSRSARRVRAHERLVAHARTIAGELRHRVSLDPRARPLVPQAAVLERVTPDRGALGLAEREHPPASEPAPQDAALRSLGFADGVEVDVLLDRLTTATLPCGAVRTRRLQPPILRMRRGLIRRIANHMRYASIRHRSHDAQAILHDHA